MVHMDSINEELTSECDFASSAPEHNKQLRDTDDIILYPFAHQVGGHTQLLTLDKGTLCKPLIPRELLFYLNVPKELAKFVPYYKGVVQIRENDQGLYPPVVYQPLRSPKSPFAKHRPGSSCTLPAKLGGARPVNSVTDLFNSTLELKVQIKPCSDEKILKKNLSQDNLLRAEYISRPNEKYLLLLENVASKYQLPCILDLKMGTRQHGDDATEEKRHRQTAKCEASTSASLGVRLCGMQVYQVDYGGFLWYDKYYGRKMDEEGLKRALHEYFQNGSHLNEDIIDDVIDRLKLLSNAVEKSPSFRFYGTSLLIIHEGCTTGRSDTKECPVDVRLIDFAHTICDYNSTSGRSSSSPSVLKSYSADQLSVAPQPPASIESLADASDPNCHHHNLHNSEQPQHSEQSQSQSQSQLDLCQNVENCQPQTDRGGGGGTIGPIEADELDVANNNSLPNNVGGGVSLNANNCNTPSNMTNNGFSSPTSATTLRPAQVINQSDSKGAPHLRDVELATAAKVTQQSVAAAAAAAAVAPSTQTNTQETTTKSTITINTPTTPPSLGSRKISKTSMGPDRGLLLGLENLMRLLNDLKSETLITC